MNRRRFVLLGSALALAAGSTVTAVAAPSEQGLTTRNVHVCAVPVQGLAGCHAIRHDTVDSHGNRVTPDVTPDNPAGWHSADLQAAYRLTGTSSATIAIVDAFDDPTAEADLAVYRSIMNLPACDHTNDCFRKINQNGVDITGANSAGTPSANTGWAEEIALDLDMASTACPSCKLLLVEANDNYFTNLGAAVDQAALSKWGVAAISNSYGGREFRSETSNTYNSHYNHPGIAITVSSGDAGYGAEFPAASQYVTAVGGTSLTHVTTATRSWSETAWSGAGSGCSAYVSKPSWQKDTSCSRRTVADVSAVADPNTGVAVYSTFNDPGWMVFGGTSASAPLIAGVYALAGNAATATAGQSYGSYPYSHASSLYDIVGGSNGRCTKGKNTASQYLCTAVTGFDGPTGLGTPNGTGAF